MQNTPRYSLMRRLLFPYSGEDSLSFRQSMRVMLAWALLIPLSMSLLTLVLAIVEAYTWQRIVTLFVFAFLSGACIFGILGWLIVVVNNRSARIRRAWKAQEGQQ